MKKHAILFSLDTYTDPKLNIQNPESEFLSLFQDTYEYDTVKVIRNDPDISTRFNEVIDDIKSPDFTFIYFVSQYVISNASFHIVPIGYSHEKYISSDVSGMVDLSDILALFHEVQCKVVFCLGIEKKVDLEYESNVCVCNALIGVFRNRGVLSDLVHVVCGDFGIYWPVRFVYETHNPQNVDDCIKRDIRVDMSDMFCLVGMAGVGKTCIARYFYAKNKLNYMFKAFMDADGLKSIKNEYKRLYKKYNFGDGEINDEKMMMVVKNELQKRWIRFDITEGINNTDGLYQNTLFYDHKRILFFDYMREEIHLVRGVLLKNEVHRIEKKYKLKYFSFKPLDTFKKNDEEALKKTKELLDPYADVLKLSQNDLYKITLLANDSCKFLLVYDNLSTDINQIRKYIPNNCHILITSRNPNWRNKLYVDVMSEEESVELFESIAGSKIVNKNDIKKLVKECAYHPLVISQIACYLAEYDDIIIDEYIRKYKKGSETTKSILSKHSSDDILPIYTTFDLNIKEIIKKCKIAFEILCLLSYLDSVNIPIEMLREYIKRKSLKMKTEKVINLLCSYSLIKYDKTTRKISINKVIQNVIQIKIKYKKIDVKFDNVKMVRTLWLVLNSLYIEHRPFMAYTMKGKAYNVNKYRKKALQLEKSFRDLIVKHGYSFCKNIMHKDIKFNLKVENKLSNYAIQVYSHTCVCCDKELFDYFISNGVDINIIDKKGRNCLLNCCYGGKKEFVVYLIEDKKCDPKVSDILGSTCLLQSCQSGSIDLIKWLLENGVSKADEINTQKENILLIATKNCNYDLVKWIFQKKDDFNIDLKALDNELHSALHLACVAGNFELFEFLLKSDLYDTKAKNNKDSTCLLLAAQNGNSEIAKYLLRNGLSDIHEKDHKTYSVLHCCGVGGSLDLCKFLKLEMRMNNLIKINQYGKDMLLYACENGHLELVMWLIKEGGASVDIRSWGPLIWAAANGNLEVVKYLLDEGGCVYENEKGKSFYIFILPDDDAWTCFHFACEKGHFNIVKYFVNEHGIDVNSRPNDGRYPILCAAQSRNYELVHFLISKGADIKSKSENGLTMLLLACYYGFFPLVKWLIQEGHSSTKEITNTGTTALIQASCGGHLEIIQYLLNDIGVDIHEKRHTDLMSPIIGAVNKGHLPALKYLLKMGANIDDKDKRGRGVEWYADNGHHNEITAYLKNIRKETSCIGNLEEVGGDPIKRPSESDHRFYKTRSKKTNK